jgi:hypothetical protein
VEILLTGRARNLKWEVLNFEVNCAEFHYLLQSLSLGEILGCEHSDFM